MRSPSIDFLYSKIEKIINLAQSYTEIDNLSFIIKACRLKPYDYFFGDRTHKLILHRWWFDEFGNSFHIVKNKRIRITYNDLKLDTTKIVCTDLYYGLSIDQVARMSKMAYVCVGKDEDLLQDCSLLTFLGVDNYLRCYLYWYGQWQQVSPLLLGFKHLNQFIDNVDVKHYRQFNNIKKFPIPCVSGQLWLTSLPAAEGFFNILKEQHNLLLPILGR